MKSALKMQKIQPQMNAVKEKYKKYGMRDPRKQDMNQEIGALMKREGVNPAGGCLPMLIQLPFLFAYYAMLGAAIDLRQAHWLWINDLSSARPVLPAAHRHYHHRAVHAAHDAAGRHGSVAAEDDEPDDAGDVRLISYRLGGGFVPLLVGEQLIAIVQQVIMNRTSLGQEMREIALKRARKKEK